MEAHEYIISKFRDYPLFKNKIIFPLVAYDLKFIKCKDNIGLEILKMPFYYNEKLYDYISDDVSNLFDKEFGAFAEKNDKQYAGIISGLSLVNKVVPIDKPIDISKFYIILSFDPDTNTTVYNPIAEMTEFGKTMFSDKILKTVNELEGIVYKLDDNDKISELLTPLKGDNT